MELVKIIVEQRRQEDSKTGYSDFDLDGPMWLCILAVCVQSGTRPLKTPLIARVTPLCDDENRRRWSPSNDITMPIKVLQQLGVDTYADSRFDAWVLLTQFITNLHQSGGSEVSEV